MTTSVFHPAIVATGLRKSFGDKVVLDGIDLHVAEGSIFSLLGPNGAGKTTSVQILSTLIGADAGQVRVAGHDLASEPALVRAAIGVTGQFSAVDGLLTGEENLKLMADLHHLERAEGRRRATGLLRRFDLADAAKKTAAAYSGGMRRRLDLGAALVANPPLLFLDEPTTGLDPQSRQDLWAIIEGLVEQGVTVLLTTQYLEEADRLCKQMVVLDHGKIIAEGTSQELKTRLGSTVLSVTFNNTDDARRGAELISDVSAKPANIEGTVVDLTVEHGPSQAADALRRLDGAGIILAGLTLREPSLDDVFLNLTGHKTEDADASTDVPAKRRERKART